jgi:hypothetical protein
VDGVQYREAVGTEEEIGMRLKAGTTANILQGKDEIIFVSFLICVMVQWRLVRGGRLIIMSGTEQMKWHQTH